MEEKIFEVITENPEALYFKITTQNGQRKASGNAQYSEELAEIVANEIEELPNGRYRFFLGKADNLSEKRAVEVVDFQKGTSETKRQTTTLKGMFTREDIEIAKREAYEAGKQEALLFAVRTDLEVLKKDFADLKRTVYKIADYLDEQDGQKDGNIGDTALDLLEKAKGARDLLTDFKL